MEWLRRDDARELGERLREALAFGGCAAVICNTVRRAQEVYLALKPFFAGWANDGGPELDLLHARFLFVDREEREERALRRFGKPGEETKRPHRAVLVATQVIEQSLDLDFDLMVTELAPADLVLQRAGRLHRHARDRPHGLKGPQLWVIGPAEEDGVPRFDRATTYVYDEHVLVRSWLALRGKPVIRVPKEVEGLVEAVYGERECPENVVESVCERWRATSDELARRLKHDQRLATNLLILPPSYDPNGFLEDLNQALEEDNPEVHPTVQALTRLGEQSVAVVCLTSGQRQALEPTKGINAERAKTLLRYSVNLTDARVVHNLIAAPGPASWRRSALLRHHRLVELNDMGGCAIGRTRLQVDPELGVRIGTEQGEV